MFQPIPRPCPVCRLELSSKFLTLHNLPVNGLALYSNAESARAAPKAGVELAFCSHCGMIYNTTFNSAQVNYDNTYENSLGHSSVFCEYLNELAGHLIQSYSLSGKTVVEVGCGDAQFLKLLCADGNNRGFGFDPSLAQSYEAESISLVKSVYDERAGGTPADFICCRHVLEHLENPHELLHAMRANLTEGNNSAIYLEVPNAMAVLTGPTAWDIHYQHCNYFTSTSLSSLLESCGFSVLRMSPTYGGQFLAVEACPRRSSAPKASQNSGDIQKVGRAVERFRWKFRAGVEEWARFLEYAHAEGRTVVLWGAGAKAVTFMNTVPGAERIAATIDSNPRKSGTFLPGTGHRLLAPESLGSIGADVIITLNPLYEHEIRRMAQRVAPGAEVVAKPAIPICSPLPGERTMAAGFAK
ncbi:MAG: class I SAM-dependent methyltransferase [Bryobacteraceae bacterium]